MYASVVYDSTESADLPAAVLAQLFFSLICDDDDLAQLNTIQFSPDENQPLALPAPAAPAPLLALPTTDSSSTATIEDLLKQVHGGRIGHHGFRRTWQLLNRHFPGHGISMEQVRTFVQECAICQKTRLGHSDALQPVYKTLLPAHPRQRVGADFLTITPADNLGNKYLAVIIVHASKLCLLYPSANKTALDMARALFSFFADYGIHEELQCDAGTEFTSALVQQLTAWFGVHQRFALVERHESNGVESTNASILRHLEALVLDFFKVREQWSQPENYKLVQYILNSTVHSETNLTPFEAHFGSADAKYFHLPEELDTSQFAAEYLQQLNSNLKILRAASRAYHEKLIETRRAKSLVQPSEQNFYQKGDLVLLSREHGRESRSNKLDPTYLGPYEVLEHVENTVTARHLASHVTIPMHCERFKPFFCESYDIALELARKDFDQFVIDRILAYRGDIATRETLEFLVRFSDSEEIWKAWDRELFATQQYEDYCRTRRELNLLLYTVAESHARSSALIHSAITEVRPGLNVYVDLRYFGGVDWYEFTDLPDKYITTYVFECFYDQFVSSKHLKIWIQVRLTKERFKFNHLDVFLWGTRTSPDNCTVITAAMLTTYPALQPTTATLH